MSNSTEWPFDKPAPKPSAEELRAKKIGFEIQTSFEPYEQGWENIAIQTNTDGRPEAYPTLDVDHQFVIGELNDHEERILFLCYNLGDMLTLFDSYVGGRREPDDVATTTLTWHLYTTAKTDPKTPTF